MLTVSMIVKDAADTLEQCLESVKDADKIIIVDTGSTDNTVEIAKRYGRVEHFEWCDDFAAARNHALSFVPTGSWVISIDADEWMHIPDGFHADAGADCYCVEVVRLNEDGNPAESFLAARVFRNSDVNWEGKVHEQISRNGKPLPWQGILPVTFFHHHRPHDSEKWMRNVEMLQMDCIDHPTDPVRFMQYAMATASVCDYEKAYLAATEALHLTSEAGVPQPPWVYRCVATKAHSAHLIGQKVEARKLLKYLQDSAPDYTDAYYIEALCAASDGRFDKVKELIGICKQMGDAPSSMWAIGGVSTWRGDQLLAEIEKAPKGATWLTTEQTT